MKQARLVLYMKTGKDITLIRDLEMVSSPSMLYAFPETFDLEEAIEVGENKVIDFKGVNVPALNVNYFEYKVL